MATARKQTPMGEHWKETVYSTPYQLYRRVETVANQLRRRQRDGHAPLVAHVTELDAIAMELKSFKPNAPYRSSSKK